MSSYNKFDVTTKDLVDGKHNFASDTFKLMLSNTLPTSSNAVKADITEISAGGGYSAGGTAVTMTVSTSSGTAKVTATNTSLTCTSSTIGPFRYLVIYNDTQASPVKPLVCWYDYGSALTLNNGDTVNYSFDGTNGLLQLV